MRYVEGIERRQYPHANEDPTGWGLARIHSAPQRLSYLKRQS
jgi:hypothetical protein